MNTIRIEQLKQFIEEEPDEPFNVYALAMEYLSGRPDEARVYFDQLLAKHPDYLPTYYHAAALYAERDEREYAAELYEKGIALAQKQQNQKALQELKRAQQTFEEDDDDW
ncbi:MULTISPECIES: tetratricopeptide repeat protein [unclassified Spirosoma]|uniref:tetratricopeptide repeat protein n=1 Tax=unclassified Spirosoma TaxID=2621999 RepID=UPI000963194A|nr:MULTISPECIES: tetratricopeptide repeat protein [unclassified Spirosoma]MBN8823709.1 tetratricopeptide repeat protein [Spirosoma sp.]OJW76744.1 MAG: enzyme of heme biosynthesis [Spirosoma sp. 48-14]